MINTINSLAKAIAVPVPKILSSIKLKALPIRKLPIRIPKVKYTFFLSLIR